MFPTGKRIHPSIHPSIQEEEEEEEGRLGEEEGPEKKKEEEWEGGGGKERGGMFGIGSNTVSFQFPTESSLIQSSEMTR